MRNLYALCHRKIPCERKGQPVDALFAILMVMVIVVLLVWGYHRARPAQGITDLKDKVVIVTGAASGIGLEIARAFSDAQARVVAVDVNEIGLMELEKGLTHRPLITRALDVSDYAALRGLIEHVMHEWGRVDVLVNNAAVSTGSALDDIEPDAALVERILDVNLRGAIHLTHLALPIMCAQGSGMIVNIVSMAALIRQPMHDVYTASKGGIDAFSDVIRRKFAHKGIKVVKVYPGLTYTTMIARNTDYAAYEQFARQNKLLGAGDKLYLPSEVAQRVVRAVRRYEKAVVFGGTLTQVITVLVRWFPLSMDAVLQGLLTQDKDRQHA